MKIQHLMKSIQIFNFHVLVNGVIPDKRSTHLHTETIYWTILTFLTHAIYSISISLVPLQKLTQF